MFFDEKIERLKHKFCEQDLKDPYINGIENALFKKFNIILCKLVN